MLPTVSAVGELSYRFEAADACVMCGGREAKTLGRRLNRHQGVRPRRKHGVTTTVVRCGGCGLVYSDPRPVPETLEQHYDLPPEEYWVAAARAGYFEQAEDYFSEQIATFRRFWTGSGIPRALDVGAGVGKTMIALEQSGFETFGIEPSPPFYERAVARGIDRDRLRRAPIETAQFEPDSFDFVIFSAVLEHLHDPAGALARTIGWTARGGVIYVEVPSANWLMGRVLNALYRVQGLESVTNLSPMHPPFHLYEFTLEAFRRHGQHAGYEVICHEFFACQTYLPRPAASVAERVMTTTNTGMMLLVWLRPASNGD
jgi:SAM-dependent methyltransferase